jgi:SSS family transporter
MSPLLLGVLGYVVVQFAIGVAVARRVRSEEDYFVAGRRLGPVLATATIFATWFGAETCLGSAGEVYEHGLTLVQAEPFAYGLCLVLAGLVLARPLWRRRLVTIADLYRERFSPGTARLAALLMIPTSVLWAAAQLRGFGQVLASASELETSAAITLAAVLVIAYTSIGGMMADVVTDLVQGVCLVIGIAALFAAVLDESGGLGALLERVPTERLQLRLDASLGAWDVLEEWAIPVLGSIVAQELVARISASRSPGVARGSTLAGGALYVGVGVVPVLLGLVAATSVAGLEDPEQVLPELARRSLSPALYVLFAGALVSAILSTVDSNLLVCSSLLGHNLIEPLRPHWSEAQRLRAARAGVVLFGVAAYLLALHAQGVFELVEQASAFGSSGIVVITLFGLFSRRGGAASAMGALVAGLTVYVAGVALSWRCPYLSSLAAALVAYLALAGRRGLAPETPPDPASRLARRAA